MRSIKMTILTVVLSAVIILLLNVTVHRLPTSSTPSFDSWGEKSTHEYPPEWVDSSYPSLDTSRGEVATVLTVKIIGELMSVKVSGYCLDPLYRDNNTCFKHEVTGEWLTRINNGKLFVIQGDDGVYYLDLGVPGTEFFIKVPVDRSRLNPDMYEVLDRYPTPIPPPYHSLQSV